jgi:hypothetical protein
MQTILYSFGITNSMLVSSILLGAGGASLFSLGKSIDAKGKVNYLTAASIVGIVLMCIALILLILYVKGIL